MAAASLTAGTRLGSYEIIGLVGAGGMGEVYQARDTRIGRLVAIKVLPSASSGDREQIRRFEQESRAAGALNHPNILTLHDVGTATLRGLDAPFLVTELLDGVTLRERLRPVAPGSGEAPTPALDLSTALDYAVQIAHGLAAAHAAGVVHRDLKPANLFVTRDGTVKILDFGLAKLTPTDHLIERAATETGIGVMLGTVGYMAPEQVRGQPVDARADLFAFGAVLYELVSGRRAFDRDTQIETLNAILAADFPPLPNTVPPALARLIGHCLQSDPAKRPRSAVEVAVELKASAGPQTAPAPIRGRDRRRQLSAYSIALAVVAISAMGLWRWRGDRIRHTGEVDTRRVVAVLPFQNIAADRSQEYFTTGMTEEISSQLSRLSSLRVMSRPAVARYTSASGNLSRIGPELGVGSLVTGSVRLSDGRVRIDVQLVDARTGETRWADQYDRDLQDVFAVQGDVARRIAGALQATLSPAEAGTLGRQPTSSVEAYQRYLRARALSSATPDQNHAAIGLLREAIALDDGFAWAHADLAVRLGWLVDFGDRSRIAPALTEAQAAVKLDPSSGRSHYALALTYMRMGRIEHARLAFLRAAELDPNSFRALADLSITEANVGHFDRALYWARRAHPLAPNLSTVSYHVGVPLILIAADGPAERWLLESERRFPDFQRVQMLLATLDALRGLDKAALDRARRAVARRPDNEEGQNMLPEFALLAGAPDAGTLIEERFRHAPEARTAGMLPETFRTFHAYGLLARGEHTRAGALLAEALAVATREIDRGSELPEERMEIAAVYALQGNTQEALKWLEDAYRHGWRLYRETGRDPLLKSLRNEPAFRELLRRMESDVAQMRRRVDVEDNPRMPGVPAERSPVR